MSGRDYQRPKTNPAELVAGGEVTEAIESEGTGVVEGEALKAIRRDRPPEDRVEHVEDRLDALVEEFARFRVAAAEDRAESAKDMGNMAGAVGKLAGEVAGLAKIVEERNARARRDSDAHAKIDEAQALDVIDAKQHRRSRLTQLFKGGAIVQAVHWIVNWIR